MLRPVAHAGATVALAGAAVSGYLVAAPTSAPQTGAVDELSLRSQRVDAVSAASSAAEDASAHAELVRGPDALTELRVGDEWVIGRWDPAAFDPMNGDEGHKLRAKHDEWARGVGLRPASTCLPRAPRSAPPPP